MQGPVFFSAQKAAPRGPRLIFATRDAEGLILQFLQAQADGHTALAPPIFYFIRMSTGCGLWKPLLKVCGDRTYGVCRSRASAGRRIPRVCGLRKLHIGPIFYYPELIRLLDWLSGLSDKPHMSSTQIGPALLAAPCAAHPPR
jgi:hypothetical protein